MDTLGDMKRTGNKVAGPSSDLVELENEKGLRHTGITFHRKFRDHPFLTVELLPIQAFLERPDVADLMELVQNVPEAGAFIYPTGMVVSVAEVLDTLARIGEPGGVKAGLELCYFVAQILQDAYVKSEPFGLYSHGDISPWRIMLKSNGRVQVIGFGLPQVDLLAARDSDRISLKEDSYRYCPPERLDGEGEDYTSDLYSLALMAFELMTGEPLFNGVLSEIKQQATNAQGPYRLYQYREKLPDSVIELLSRCLKYDMDSRHGDINEFIWEVRDVLALPEVDGPSLEEIATRVKNRIMRKRSSTGAYTEEDLADFAKEAEGIKGAGDLPEPKQARPGEESQEERGQRWGRVARSGSRESRRGGRGGGDEKPSLRERLKRSSGREAPSSSKSSKEALKSRLKRSRGRDEAPPSRSRDAEPASRGRESLRRSRASRGDRSDPSPRSSGQREGLRSSSDRSAQGTDAGLSKSGRAASLLKRLRSSKGSESQEPSASEGAGAPSGLDFEVVIDDMPAVSVKVEAGSPIACLAARALQDLGGARLSFTGTLEGWFSVEQSGGALSSADKVEVLDADQPVHLVFQPSRIVCLDFSVSCKPRAQFRAPVNVGLPAGAVLEQVLIMLELDGEGWHIAVDDEVLHPLQPLGEVIEGPGRTLVVSK